MIVDARSTNFCCKPPPHTALGTATALVDVDLSLDKLLAVLREEVTPSELADFGLGTGPLVEIPLTRSSADAKDGFYQFSCTEMSA